MSYEDSEPVAGYAAVAEGLAADGAGVGAIAEALAAHAENTCLPMPVARNASSLRLLADRLSRRRLVAELGVYPATVEWLTLHVPQPGTAALDWNVTGEKDATVAITLVAGVGTGRKISWSAQQSIPPQLACLRFLQHVAVEVRLYEHRDGVIDRQVDVVATRGRELATVSDCHLCCTRWEDIDPFEFEALETIDYRNLESGAMETYNYDVSRSRTLEIGVTLPALENGRFGMSVRNAEAAGWQVKYQFPGGRIYLGVRPTVALV